MAGQSGKEGGAEMWGQSLQFWESVVFWATVVAFIAGGIGVIAAFVSAIVGSQVTDRVQRDADERISEAHERAASANERAASAHEHATELERQAAVLRLQLEREVGRRAPRTLSDEQKSSLTTALSGKIDGIRVVVQRDLEAELFAFHLEIAFQAAGARVRPYEMPPGHVLNVPAGVMMYMPGGATDESTMKDDPLYIALNKARLFGGATAKPYASPRDISPGAPMLPDDQHIVYVGQKSPY